MEQLTPAFFFRQENCYQQSTKIRCPPPTKAWSYINTCAGVTAGTWAAHLKDCMIELHNTSRNPSETNLYPQEPYQHVTENKGRKVRHYNDQQFSILAKARTPFHLAALEATYITIHQPVLCRHKEFVYALQISH